MKATLKGVLLGTSGGHFAGKRIGKHLAKRKMTKSLINRIKYSPLTPMGQISRAKLLKRYEEIGALTGENVGALTGGGLGVLKDIKDMKRIFREGAKRARNSKGWKDYQRRQRHSGSAWGNRAAKADVDDLLKRFSSKRKSDFKTKRDVKTEFRTAARKHHPDRGGNPEKMKAINESWGTIKETDWFQKLAALAAMRDEMSSITGMAHTHRAKLAFAAPISTKPLNTSMSIVPPKSGSVQPGGAGKAPSKNAGAPKGPRAVALKGVKATPLNKPPVTNA